MNYTQLKAYKVSEINFVNDVHGRVELKLGNKVSHNVKYSKDGMCEAVLKVEVCDKDKPDCLRIALTVTGIFQIVNETEKEFIHVETFKELFPYAKSMITMITAAAGIPPVIIENVDIESQNIYRMQL